MRESLLDELKVALKLQDHTITSWAKTLENPQGEKVHRTTVYKAIKDDGPQWLIDEIHDAIAFSKQHYPDYYENRCRNDT